MLYRRFRPSKQPDGAGRVLKPGGEVPVDFTARKTCQEPEERLGARRIPRLQIPAPSCKDGGVGLRATMQYAVIRRGDARTAMPSIRLSGETRKQLGAAAEVHGETRLALMQRYI